MKESRELEFKSDVTNTFLKTVSAFANFGSGTIMFGVDDNGIQIGVNDPDEVSLDIENRVNDSISPKPDYSINVNRSTNVISLIVSEGRYKPYLYRGKAYRRNGTATVEVDQVELRRLTLKGANLYYEGLSCGLDKLKFSYFEYSLIEILGISGLSDDILRTFGFFNEDKKYNVAAALFADENPYSGIDAARFGSTISEILDREILSGISILKQYDMAVSMFRRYYQYEIIEGIERKKTELVPETAFREALANALVHRTWDVNSHIRIFMFSDRVEILSPGGLPSGINEEEFLNGYISNLRNPVIGNVFFRLGYIEMFGTGIRRIIDAYSGIQVKPSFSITDNSVKVVLPNKNMLSGMTPDGQKVSELFSSGMILSSTEAAEKLGWEKSKVLRILNTRLSFGYIKKIGNGRGTRYAKR